MKRYTSTRVRYLRGPSGHPHTCIAVQVDAGKNEIRYAISRRESQGKLVFLKNRMRQIRNLGGLVPEKMVQAQHSYPRDFSKATARKVAINRLLIKPHVISNVDCSTLNGHTITQMVMEALISDYRFDYRAEVGTAAEAASEWLTKNVEIYKSESPQTLIDNTFLETLNDAAGFFRTLSPLASE